MSDQEALEIELIADRREQVERAYYFWRGQIGGVDEPVDFSDAGNPVVAMLAMQHQWRQLTAALDRRLARLP